MNVHVMISHGQRVAQAYDETGKKLWRVEALTEGVGGPQSAHAGDTPFGDYKATSIVPTTSKDTKAIWDAYGPYFISLYDIEGQESSKGREGIGVHGGGTGLPDPQAPMQELCPTLGCIRLHNKDLSEIVVPLVYKTLEDKSVFKITVGK